MKSQAPNLHYFDYNATHPPIKNILETCLSEYISEFSNPSGATRFSLSNQGKIESARNFFSSNDFFPVNGHIFSSTGTEANYTLLAGLRKKLPDCKEIYTSSIEHSSFYSACEYFEFQPILLKSERSGEVDLQDLRNQLRTKPLPVGIIYAGNETGVIQNMKEIHIITKEYNSYLISDCMQAFGKILIDYSLLDGYTCSGHKIGAGMGTGLTGFSERLLPKELSFIQGGNQENGYRAGTENLLSIVSFHQTAKFMIEQLGGSLFHNLIIRKRIDDFLQELGAEIVSLQANRLPNTCFAILPLEDLDFFMMGLEERNVQISTGSSCKSRAREASPSLLRMGYSEDEALRGIRISWGINTTNEEVDYLLQSIQEISENL